MKYRITIQKIQTIKTVDTEWQRQYDSEAFDKVHEKDPDIKQYAYEEIPVEKEESRDIYTQTVEAEIDLKAIIDAFNK